jgi:hypothetical protein
MPTYTFQEVKRSAKRTMKCRTCGKRFTRSQTFMQTINPFNKNADGDVKSYAEIWRELGVEADAWRPDDRCTSCAAEVTR